MWEIDDFILFRKIPRKDKWGYCDDIPLLPLLGSGHHLPLFLMSKQMFILIVQKNVLIKFTIKCMVNPTLNVDKVFIEQVDKCLNETFHPSTISGIRNVIEK